MSGARGRREARPCAHCGAAFPALAWEVRRGRGVFCSPACRLQAGHGGRPRGIRNDRQAPLGTIVRQDGTRYWLRDGPGARVVETQTWTCTCGTFEAWAFCRHVAALRTHLARPQEGRSA